jgi:hypothetical protein
VEDSGEFAGPFPATRKIAPEFNTRTAWERASAREETSTYSFS